jgi:hypothetical protein
MKRKMIKEEKEGAKQEKLEIEEYFKNEEVQKRRKRTEIE